MLSLRRSTRIVSCRRSMGRSIRTASGSSPASASASASASRVRPSATTLSQQPSKYYGRAASSHHQSVIVPAVKVPLTDRFWRQHHQPQQQPPQPQPLPQHRHQSAVAATAENSDVSSNAVASPPLHANSSSYRAGGEGHGHPQNHPHHPEVDPDFLREVGILDRDGLLTLASQKPTPLRLADMYKYGRNSSDLKHRLLNAQFLHREMPIRIAQRAVDLLTLPHGLSEAKPIRQVAEIYLRYLQKLRSVPCPKTKAEEDAFTDLLQGFVLDRTSIPESIALGVNAWREHHHRISSSNSSATATGSTSSTTTTSSNKEHDGEEQEEEMMEQRLQEMEDALYRFFTARVGLRFITEHHVLSSRRPECQALRKVTHMFPEDYNKKSRKGNIDDDCRESYELGCIQSNCNLVDETRKVADLVMKQTTAFYGLCPPIEIVDCQQQQYQHNQQQKGGDSNNNNNSSSGGSNNNNNNFTYVTHHLHYMLAELLKNSCRATIEQYLSADLLHGGKDDHHLVDGEDDVNSHGSSSSSFSSLASAKLHPIRVILTKGEEDVTIKIADKGGGIPRSWMNHLWKFGSHHSQTADFGTIEGHGEKGGGDARILRGFGLPLARIYARYFGGELNLKSMEGYGVDAYLHLPRLGSSCESLPLRVRASPGERDSTPGRQYVRGFTTHAPATAATATGTTTTTLASPGISN